MNFKQNFVIDYLRGVKISYNILTQGRIWIAFGSVKIKAL